MKIQNFLSLLAIASMVMIFVSCDKDNNDKNNPKLALELRAQTLGFEDVGSYVAFVQTNCTQGNHQNCNILASGEHRVCDNVHHEGQHFTGEHLTGSKHENCGEGHRSCCSGQANHHSENHHGGNGH